VLGRQGCNYKSQEFIFFLESFPVMYITTFSAFRFVSQSFPLLPTHSRCRGCLFSLDHNQTHTTVGRTPLDEGSARRRDLYLTTQTLYKKQTSIPPVGFEPTIPASARPQTYASDRATTGVGYFKLYHSKHNTFHMHGLFCLQHVSAACAGHYQVAVTKS
jgi:hypothetical protein